MSLQEPWQICTMQKFWRIYFVIFISVIHSADKPIIYFLNVRFMVLLAILPALCLKAFPAKTLLT